MWVDGDKSAGIWQCTPGPSYWVQEENEVIYLLSGRMTVTPDGGEPSDVGTGDIAVFATGWKGTPGIFTRPCERSTPSSDLDSVSVAQRLVRQRGFRRAVIDNPECDAIAGVVRWRVRSPARRFCGALQER